MDNKFSFYFQYNNVLFNGNVLAICYKADQNEVKEYGLTGSNILIFIKNKKLDDFFNRKDINYFIELKKIFHKQKINLRIQSECLLGMYGDTHCDCEKQRNNFIDVISKNGGIFIHLPQEGQGWGLHYKLQELELQVSGRTSSGEFIGIKNRDDAQKFLLGNKKFDDCRGYGIIQKILFNLGLNKENFVLISESEKKLNALKECGLKVIKYSDYLKEDVNQENISEYLVKILNSTHTFDEKTINKIVELIENRKYNGRTISTLISIIDRINNDKEYNLDSKFKKLLLNAYDKIICGVEKKYIIGDSSVINLKNAFSCKVNSSVFKALHDIYEKNIFDRVSLEKLYYFENKFDNKSVRIRSSKVLNTIGKSCIFMKGQIHLEQRIFNEEKTQIVQNEISLSKLRSYFENNNYDYIKRVEMITTISEGQIPGINIYIKKIPNIENRIMDVYGKKKDIQNFIKILSSKLSRNVLNEVVSNSDYEDENFTNYNLRFADLDAAIEEELAIYRLLNKGEE